MLHDKDLLQFLYKPLCVMKNLWHCNILSLFISLFIFSSWLCWFLLEYELFISVQYKGNKNWDHENPSSYEFEIGNPSAPSILHGFFWASLTRIPNHHIFLIKSTTYTIREAGSFSFRSTIWCSRLGDDLHLEVERGGKSPRSYVFIHQVMYKTRFPLIFPIACLRPSCALLLQLHNA